MSSTTGDAPAPLILVSLDGFRDGYARRYDAPALDRMARTGTKADYLKLAFPTKTFPNHYTLVTGQYPARHGIISNNIYDPVFDASFSLGNTEAIRNARWWGAEPIWVTAEKQGLTAATYFWPGSEAAIGGVRPTYWRRYDGSVPGAERVDQVLQWLDRPPSERPDLVTLYFSAVDGAGHAEGPRSPAVAEAVTAVDGYLERLYDGLRARGQAEKVNVIVTSDHGMAPLSRERVIFLDDYLTDTGGRPAVSDLRITDDSPILMAWPKDGTSAVAALKALRGAHPELDVYHKSAVPDSLHFSGSRRIPPIIGIASAGWSISTHDYFAEHDEAFTGGTHGYVPSAPSMRGILYARGPAFASGQTTRPVEAINLYRLMCRLLGLDPAPNDGGAEALRKLLPATP